MDTEGLLAPRGDGPYQRADGRWTQGYTDAGGKRKSVYGKTRAEAKRKHAAAVADRDRGIRPVETRHRLGAWLDLWIAASNASNAVRRRSIVRYGYEIAKWKADPLARKYLTEIGPGDVTQALARMAERGASPAARVMALAVLRAALDSAQGQGLVAINYAKAPYTATPKRETYEAMPPTVAELARLRTALVGHPLAAVFLLAIDGGLRQGEILALRMADLDIGPERSRVTVRGTLEYGSDVIGPPKSKRGRRRLTIPQSVATAIAVHLATRYTGRQLEPGELIFQAEDGRAWRGRRVLRHWHALCRQAGVTEYRFHDLRHAFVTDALERGVPMAAVSRYVGHAAIGVTVDRYGHLQSETIEIGGSAR